MGIVTRNRPFFLTAGLILIAGVALFFSAVQVYALVAGPGAPASATNGSADYNAVDSYGLTGMAPLVFKPTVDTPKSIAQPLKQKRGVILLVYMPGATGDEQMLTSFNKLKSKYADSASFFSFEQMDVSAGDLGDVLQQLGNVSPPMLAIIRGDGKVSQLYSGWIDDMTMEQQISNAIGY